jgi:hypothetical protein
VHCMRFSHLTPCIYFSVSVKGRERLQQLSDYQLLKKFAIRHLLLYFISQLIFNAWVGNTLRDIRMLYSLHFQIRAAVWFKT